VHLEGRERGWVEEEFFLFRDSRTERGEVGGRRRGRLVE
jgi:hypothetical protein